MIEPETARRMPNADDATTLVSLPVIAALVALVWGLLARNPFPDGDPYWHLAAARWIVAHQTVPTGDVFSHSVPGLAWTAHEWLSELLMLGLSSIGGWQAIHTAASIAFAATAAITIRFLLARMEPVHAIALGGVCLAVVNSHFMARPHVFVWPLMALWVATLVSAAERAERPPMWLPVLLVCWANMHGSFTLGIALALGIAGEAVLRAGTVPAGITVAKRWAPFIVVMLIASLLTPRGISTYAYAADLMGQRFTLSVVTEWRSADFHDVQVFLVWLLGLLFIGLLGGMRLSPARAAMVVGLTYIALKHQRYHSTAGLVSPFLLALPLGESARRRPVAGANAEGLDRLFARLARATRPAGVALASLAAVVIVLAAVRLAPRTPADAVTPRAALAAFRTTRAKGKVFNTYVYGGYLIHEGIPVFLDGRGDMYGDAFLREYGDAIGLTRPGALEATLTKYDIGWTLLAPETPAIRLLDVKPEWQRIHADSVAVVHVRRDLLERGRATPTASR